MIPQLLGLISDSAGRACQARCTSNPGPSGLGQLVDLASARTRDRVGRDSWWTPYLLGMGRNRPGSRVDIASARTGDCVGRDSWSNAQLLGSRVTSAGAAGRPAAPRTRDRLARDRWWTRVTSNLGRVGRDSWSITSQLGAGTESPGTAGQPCVSSGPGLSRPGWLVDPTAPRTQVRGGGDRVATPRKRGQ